VERYLKNLRAWAWEYLENRRNYAGFHFTADRPSCEALIQCLETLVATGPDNHRTIPLRALDPADEAKISGGQRYRSLETLRLEYVDVSEPLQQMLVRREASRLLIRFTSLRLPDLRAGFQDVLAGTGDYSISPFRDKDKGWTLGASDHESAPLWFWPCFGHYSVDKAGEQPLQPPSGKQR
jgi:hypothetical protein